MVITISQSIHGAPSLSVSGPSVWNNLSDYLRNMSLSIVYFKRYLKTFLLAHNFDATAH